MDVRFISFLESIGLAASIVVAVLPVSAGRAAALAR